MVVIDPGDPASWPQDVADEVGRLAALCRSNPENADRPCFELEVSSWEESYAEELAFRDLIGGRYIAYFHATRLLPHEDQMYADDGLLVLSDELRNRRLDRVIELYGAEVGTEGLEALRHGVHHSARTASACSTGSRPSTRCATAAGAWRS